MVKKHVFICGLHRSGTTPLARLLATHPDISAFRDTDAPEDEGQHLQDVYPAARVYGGPGKFAFNHDAHLTEHSPLVTPANRARLLQQWERYWDATKPLLLEKSPPNVIRSRFLQALFPESFFIFLIRHPVPVAFATQKWSHTDISSLIRHWQTAHALMQKDMLHLNHVLLLRYEDWMTEPQQTIDRLCGFLGITSIRAVHFPDYNADYFKYWESTTSEQKQLHQEAIQLAPLAAEFGYRFEAPHIIAINKKGHA